MQRLLAIVAAVLLIAGAVFLRSRLDSRDDATAAAQGQVNGTLVCASELRRVCETLGAANPTLTIRVEDAGATYAALIAGNATSSPVDAWLAPQPWPTMVEEARQRNGQGPVFDATSPVLARSPLVLVMWTDRFATLQKRCENGTVDWRCVSSVGGQPWADVGGDAAWGQIKPGHPPADKSATGLFVFTQATGSQLGRMDFARNDLAEPAYREWATRFEQSIPTFTPSAGTALDQMLSQGRSSFDVAGSIEAVAGPAVSSSREKDNLRVLYPSPMVSADVVLAPIKGSPTGARVQSIVEAPAGAQALAGNGWRVPGQPAVTGVQENQPVPDPNPLPRAGVLEAVRETWTEVN